jgi:hypothetical protein
VAEMVRGFLNVRYFDMSVFCTLLLWTSLVRSEKMPKHMNIFLVEEKKRKEHKRKEHNNACVERKEDIVDFSFFPLHHLPLSLFLALIRERVLMTSRFNLQIKNIERLF